MDFTRSYLDEKVWSNPWNKGEPMADYPGKGQDKPAVNSLVIDFTHAVWAIEEKTIITGIV